MVYVCTYIYTIVRQLIKKTKQTQYVFPGKSETFRETIFKDFSVVAHYVVWIFAKANSY